MAKNSEISIDSQDIQSTDFLNKVEEGAIFIFIYKVNSVVHIYFNLFPIG